MSARQAPALAGLIWCPFPDEPAARAAAGALLDEGLIACANLLPMMASLHIWQGERLESRECGALFKTSGSLLDLAVDRLDELHPYDAPAIIAWQADRINSATADWLGALGPGITPA